MHRLFGSLPGQFFRMVLPLLCLVLLPPATERVAADVAGTPVPGNLVTNGSFEEPPNVGSGWALFPGVPGWRETTGCTVELWFHNFIRTARDGHQLVELDSNCNARLEQMVATVPGQTYTLSYWFSARPGTSPDSNALNVFVNGVLVGSHVAIASDFTSWRQFTTTIVATSSATKLEFNGAGINDSLGSLLDDVSLVPSAPPVAPPTFSRPFDVPDNVNGVCICTPLLMNTNIAGTQTWWVKAIGGPLTITAVAHAVNPLDPEKVVAKVYRGATLEHTLVAEYPPAPAPGLQVSDSTVVGAAPGEIFRIEVSTPSPTQPMQPHYRLKFENAEVVGTGSPSSPSFEHDDTTWFFSVGASEDLNVRVFTADVPLAPGGASSMTFVYRLIPPSGPPLGPYTLTGPLPPAYDQVISVPGAAPGNWGLEVLDSSFVVPMSPMPQGAHYRLDKTTGADRGIYLSWLSAGEGRLHLTAVSPTSSGAPFTGAVGFEVVDAAGAVVRTGTTSTGAIDFSKLPVGHYTVNVTSVPPGWSIVDTSQPVVVLCDRVTGAQFVLFNDPPALTMPPDDTIEATSAAGAAYTYSVSATDDLDDVVAVCAPPSGSTFPLGPTTVVCSATDLAGATTTDSFVVTVVDRTAPSGQCTPSYNPSTKNVPRASRRNEDGFYVVGASDTVTASPRITIGSYELRNGETVKFTQAPGFTGVAFVNNQGQEPIRHFRVGPGDPVITITDEAGNTSTQTCYVPPIPK